jgi:hypothetical protein
VKLALTPPPWPESGGPSSASLFPDESLPPQEQRIRSLLKADEATPIDELVENWKTKFCRGSADEVEYHLLLARDLDLWIADEHKNCKRKYGKSSAC